MCVTIINTVYTLNLIFSLLNALCYSFALNFTHTYMPNCYIFDALKTYLRMCVSVAIVVIPFYVLVVVVVAVGWLSALWGISSITLIALGLICQTNVLHEIQSSFQKTYIR